MHASRLMLLLAIALPSSHAFLSFGPTLVVTPASILRPACDSTPPRAASSPSLSMQVGYHGSNLHEFVDCCRVEMTHLCDSVKN